MSRCCIAAVFALALLLCLPLSVLAGKRVALVIGNGGYASSPLHNPVNDAKDVASALRGLGFGVILKTDADKRVMVDAVSAFGGQAQGAEVALFYYAGHGLQVGGLNYLVPVGANVRSEADVEFESMSADRVLAQMESARAKVNLVVLDACRNNPFRYFRSSARGLAVVRAVTGSVVVYATSPGDVAEDGGSGRNSPFARNLLKHMATPGLEVKAMFNRVGAAVAEESRGGQVPWINSSLFQDIYLAGAPLAASAPPPPPSPPAQVSMTSRPASPPSDKTWTDPTTGAEFIWIPGGCFQMGSPPSEEGRNSDEGPVHEVCVDGFWMGKVEVTDLQYQRYVSGRTGTTLADVLGGGKPASVSWEQAMKYGQWLTGMGKGKFRLPTEAEWEYAARAGTNTARYWGDGPDEACRHANVADRTFKLMTPNSTGFHNCEDGYFEEAPGGSFKPNAFGLYDMLGNHSEWCADVYYEDAYSKHSRQNPLVLGNGTSPIIHVIRGGSFSDEPSRVRSAFRGIASDPSIGDIPVIFEGVGFRLVRTE